MNVQKIKIDNIREKESKGFSTGGPPKGWHCAFQQEQARVRAQRMTSKPYLP